MKPGYAVIALLAFLAMGAGASTYNQVSPSSGPAAVPTAVTLPGAATSASTNVGKFACLRVTCSVDCTYRLTLGGSTGVATDNDLPAATPERFCTGVNDTITFYSATAGTAKVALVAP